MESKGFIQRHGLTWIRFTAILLFMTGLFHLGGGQSVEPLENCDRKLNDLCESLGQARACHTVPYCIHCVWNTAIIPKDDENLCSKCKNDMIQSKHLLEDSTTFRSHLESTCNLHLDEMDQLKCTDVVKDLSPQLIQDITTMNMEPHDICALQGLCHSRFEVSLSNADSLENSAPDETPEVPNTGELLDTNRPVAMAAKGVGVGGRGIGSSTGRSSFGFGKSTTSTMSRGSFSGGSVSSVNARGSVNRIGSGSHYRPGGGMFIPIFLMAGGAGYGLGRSARHSCSFQEEPANSDNSIVWGGLIIVLSLALVGFCVCRNRQQ